MRSQDVRPPCWAPSSSERQSDRIHITAAGHDRLAAAILPEALAVLGR